MGQHLRTGVRLSSSPPQKRDVSFRTSLFLCAIPMLFYANNINYYFILFILYLILFLFLFFSYIRDAKKKSLNHAVFKIAKCNTVGR